MPALRIEALRRDHLVETFDCGVEPLNKFLVNHALANQNANASRTYVALEGDRVAGFYTLVFGHVENEAAPEHKKKGLARHPVPIMVLARLAVHVDWRGRGVGIGLLKNAAQQAIAASAIAGLRALVVHAKDDAARSFYAHFGFRNGFTDPLHLYQLIKDLKE